MDPELPGTGLGNKGRARVGGDRGRARPTYQGRGDQLESSRYGGNMIEDCEKPIRDVMQQGQQKTECGYCKFIQITMCIE
jgi:hypothetical protein